MEGIGIKRPEAYLLSALNGKFYIGGKTVVSLKFMNRFSQSPYPLPPISGAENYKFQVLSTERFLKKKKKKN